jgi:hypothetical protein
MYFNDFKPYLYMTNDYGEHWTLLTDGTNGIPADQPMHVVREDPEQEGLLYAGTLQGAYVSFDNGKHWQTLQQNLPATAVTDFKVHHGDLLASTMGRSFWVMDDVAPLRQIAASVTKTTRARSTNGAAGVAQDSGPARRVSDVALASLQTPAAAPPATPEKAAAPSMARQPIKPFDKSNVFLFTPAPAYRAHYPASSGHPELPEYPVIGARIDYYLANPSGEATLEILDATGKVVRSYTSEARGAAPAGRGGRRGGGAPSSLPKKAGMNRFVWDLRYGATTDGAGGGGPLVAPGVYKARFTADGVTKTEPIVVKIDPRVAKDNVTTADLVEQAKFALKVRDALTDARALAAKVKAAIDSKNGDVAKLQDLQSRLVTKTGPYEDQMFIDQLSNVGREVNQADQKVGASAFDRFNELMKEWATIKADADKVLH